MSTVTGSTEHVGRVLAGRYRLVAAVGTGASGRVYRAEDTRLRRTVAVKLLHSALAEDAGFLRRFRAEAQVAASLQHPHIMTVHDWGEDEMPFMVLELLEGGSLRSMLDSGIELTNAQAARIGRDVATALDYAHSRGIIHRDIKPANLLFDEHGIVRVADFGLARALAEASWTEPAGAVLGTARYASPEQAQALPLDARSDLYSLALVLVEAVTGRVPFGADTMVATLAARTQRPLIAPDELGALKPVIDRAGRIDRAERYPDAATMAEALTDAADALPRPTPLVLPGASDGVDPHPTKAVAVEPSAELYDQDARADDISAPAAQVRRARRARRRLVPVVVGLALVAALVAGIVLLAGTGSSTAPVPGLVGLDEAAASEYAQRNGFEVEITDRVEAPDPAGMVIAQTPDVGAWVSGSSVRLVVSSGPAAVIVPDVAGQPIEEVLVALDDVALVATVEREFSDEVEVDRVVRLEPASGSEVAPDSTVVVVVSDGPAPVPIPALRESAPDDAVATLTDAGLVAVVVEDYSDEVAEGLVVGTDPGPGSEVEVGSEVRVVVSLGPELIEVPGVVGSSIEEATAELESAGFQVEVRGRYSPGVAVRGQSPGAGELARRGAVIALQLGGSA